MRTGDPPIEVGRRTGRARRAGPAPAADPVGELAREMARLGFEPEVEVPAADTPAGPSVTMTLANCPFAATARLDPETVCSLHLGMAQGLAGAIGGIEVTGLCVDDPVTAGCRLRIQDQGR